MQQAIHLQLSRHLQTQRGHVHEGDAMHSFSKTNTVAAGEVSAAVQIKNHQHATRVPSDK